CAACSASSRTGRDRCPRSSRTSCRCSRRCPNGTRTAGEWPPIPPARGPTGPTNRRRCGRACGAAPTRPAPPAPTGTPERTRRASVGLALTPENTHPFVEGEVTFSHNGQFDLSDQLRTRILARGGRAPVGTTDSELFLSLVTAWAAQLRPQDGRADWALAIQH